MVRVLLLLMVGAVVACSPPPVGPLDHPLDPAKPGGPTPVDVRTDGANNLTAFGFIATGSFGRSIRSQWPILDKGTCFSTEPEPDLSDTCLSNGPGYGLNGIRVQMTNLQPNTTYHYRSYARDENGFHFGGARSVKTLQGFVTFDTLTTQILIAEPIRLTVTARVRTMNAGTGPTTQVCYSMTDPTVQRISANCGAIYNGGNATLFAIQIPRGIIMYFKAYHQTNMMSAGGPVLEFRYD